VVPGCPCPSLRRWGCVIAKAVYDDDGGWCLGVVAAVHADGRLDVQYDNGDEEQRKEPARVRRLFKQPPRPAEHGHLHRLPRVAPRCREGAERRTVDSVAAFYQRCVLQPPADVALRPFGRVALHGSHCVIR